MGEKGRDGLSPQKRMRARGGFDGVGTAHREREWFMRTEIAHGRECREFKFKAGKAAVTHCELHDRNGVQVRKLAFAEESDAEE